MGVDAADYDGSGRPSLVIGNFSNEMMALYTTRATACSSTRRRPRRSAGRSLLTLTFACFFFDYDLDGRLDIFAANGHVADDISTRAADASPTRSRRTCSAISARGDSRTVDAQVGRGVAAADGRARRRLRRLRRRRRSRPAGHDQQRAGAAAAQRRRRAQPAAAHARCVGTASNRDAHRRAGHASRTATGAGAVADGEDRLELLLAERAAADVRPRRRAKAVSAIEVTWPSGTIETLPATRRQSGAHDRGRQGRRRRRSPLPHGGAAGDDVDAPPAPHRDRRARRRLRRVFGRALGGQAPSAREAAYRANNLGVALARAVRLRRGRRRRSGARSTATRRSRIARLNLGDRAVLRRPARRSGARSSSARAQRAARAPARRLRARPDRARRRIGPTRRSRPSRACCSSTRPMRAPRSTSASSTCSSALRRSADVVPSRRWRAEPYNATAAYNLAIALTQRRRPTRARRAMERFETLRDSSLRDDLLADLSRAGPLRRGDRVDRRRAGAGRRTRRRDVERSPTRQRNRSPPAAATPAASAGAHAVRPRRRRRSRSRSTAAAALRLFATTTAASPTSTSARASTARSAGVSGIVAGDYDNDGDADLFVFARRGPAALLRQEADGSVRRRRRGAGLPAVHGACGPRRSLDVDHDGDLDIVVAGLDGARQPVCCSNNGNGTLHRHHRGRRP